MSDQLKSDHLKSDQLKSDQLKSDQSLVQRTFLSLDLTESEAS